MIIFDRNDYTWFLSFIERFFDFWQKTFASFQKLRFTCPKDFSEESKASIRTINLISFGPWAGKFQNLVNFFWRSFKSTINACRVAFGGKDNYWVKPWQFWQKLLARVSMLLSTWPRNLLILKMPEFFSLLIPFFEQKTFQIFGQVFPAGLPNMHTSCQASFAREMIYFGKSSCFTLVFRVWVEDFWFLPKFCAGFSKLHSACAEDCFEEKMRFVKKVFFQLP